MNRRSLILGYFYAFTGAALFSTKAIFAKLAYEERPDALLVMAWRMIFALPVFAAIGLYILWRKRQSGESLPGPAPVMRAAFLGFLGYYAAMFLDFQALIYITAQLERLALFTYPFFVLLLGAAFFGGVLTKGHVAAVIIGYLGLACVFAADFHMGGSNVPLGTLLVLGSAIVFALYQLMAKDSILKLGSGLFTSIALSSAAIASLLHFFLLRGAGQLPVSSRYLGLAAGIGLFATVIPSFFVNAGLARIGPQSTAMISTISPLVTIFLAVALLGEPFTWVTALGTVLVFIGIGYNSWLDFNPPRK